MKQSNTNNMDNLFNDHFLNTSVSVPHTEDLWNNIQQERKPTNKGILPWIFFASLLTLTGIGFYYNSIEVKSNQTASPVEQEIAQVSSVTAAPIKAETAIAAIPKTKEKRVEVLPQTVISEDKDKRSKIVVPTKEILVSNTTLNKNSEKTINPISIPGTTIPLAINTMKSPSSNKELIANPPLFVSGLRINSLSSLTVEDNYSIDLLLNGRKNKWSQCNVRQPGSLFVNVYGQASYPITEQVEEMQDDEMTSTYRADWDEKFNPFMSYMGGLQLGYIAPWGGYISAGVAYQHFQTKYQDMQRVVEQITVFDDMAYFYIDTDGQTVWVADSVSVTNIYDRERTLANNHELWHIPIQIGFVTQGNSLRVGANLEGLINISKSYEGQFLHSNGSITAIDTANDADYMSTNLGFGLSAGLHIGYMMGENMEIYLSPRFRFNNQSYLHSSQPLSVKRQFAGLRLGLNYHF